MCVFVSLQEQRPPESRSQSSPDLCGSHRSHRSHRFTQITGFCKCQNAHGLVQKNKYWVKLLPQKSSKENNWIFTNVQGGKAFLNLWHIYDVSEMKSQRIRSTNCIKCCKNTYTYISIVIILQMRIVNLGKLNILSKRASYSLKGAEMGIQPRNVQHKSLSV